MSHKTSRTVLTQTSILFFLVLLTGSGVRAQVSGGTDINLAQKVGYQNECAISKNPTNKLQLFALCNDLGGTGLFAARSTNGGTSWVYPDAADKTIADGDANQGPAACCDPTLAWDTNNNLFITYINSARDSIVTILSTDGGSTFANLITFGPASVDQPTVVADAGAVWIVWNQGGSMVARGAPVTGTGTANVGAFHALQNIPGTANCSFGDIAIAPGGAVVQVCESLLSASGETMETLRVNTDADGLGPGNFAASVAATTTNVGGFDRIPAQNSRSIDAEAGLAFDRNQFGDPSFPGGLPSPHFGRLYLVYTEEPVDESNDTNIMLRWSDDNGATWPGGPIRVDDDPGARSQFFPKIATNRLSGNIGVCWLDARNSATNNAVQEFCTIATPTGASPAFMASAQISGGASITSANLNQFGDYQGLDYFQGRAHPIWGDTSNNGGTNPDGTAEFDAYTDTVSGGMAANEGDPHLTTVDGVHYDFQSAGEFVVLRDGDGLEIQTRQSPVATASMVGPNGHTGLTTCVSLNTAVAARVAGRRVTFQNNISGQPDPSGLQLRVDGVLTTLGPGGLSLGGGGHIMKSGDGITITFPDDTILVATPNFWTTYGRWYLNVQVFHTPALEGIMGAIARGSWLPLLPDGTSLGPMPAPLHQRYLDLYQRFANAWRVTNKTSLFDYAPGTSTADFTIASWPNESLPCDIPDAKPVKPVSDAVAQEACRRVEGKERNANCVFDVTVTGELGFAKLYLMSQRIETGFTHTIVSDDKDPTKPTEPVTFTAVVTGTTMRGQPGPTGTVQFFLDGERAADPVLLDKRGYAIWRVPRLKEGRHEITAVYIPAAGSPFLSSTGIKVHRSGVK